MEGTRMKRILPILVFFAVLPLLPAQQAGSKALRFGMPTGATADPSHRDDFLIQRPQFALSYNAKTETPNWVAWTLQKADIGKSQRGPFEPDSKLPKGYSQVTSHTYDGSGFDRGHMCPAQDRS